MESIGLMPSNTGLPGGKKTGQQMTHYVIEGGPFETICKELLANNFKISWADRFIPINFLVPTPEPGGKTEPEPKIKSKNKYICAECGASVWGKPDLKIICGQCQREFQRD
jgi:DNA-directed RNA polymerase subunit RPC12/RpoP